MHGFPRHCVLFLAALPGLVACADWPTEHSLPRPRIEYRQGVVSGEIQAGQQALFEIAGERDRKFRVRFQALSGNPSDTLHLDVVGATTSFVLASTSSTGLDPTLKGQSTPWVRFPGSVPYLIRIRGAGPTHEGGFRFEVETGERTIVPGDTVTGELFPPSPYHDTDHYRFEARKGQIFNVFFHRYSGSVGGLLLEVLRGNAVLTSVRGMTPGVESMTGRFEIPADGEYTLRVSGEILGIEGIGRGEYHIELYEIDRRPEAVAARLSIGDNVTEEAIDRPGDIDEFVFAGVRGVEMNVVLEAENHPWELRVQVLDPAGTEISHGISSTERFTLTETGDHTIIVKDSHSMFTGRYRLRLHPVNRMPERIPEEIFVGTWVVGEAIDEIGDIDTFRYYGTEGQEIVILGWSPEGAEIRIHQEGVYTSVLSAWDVCTERYQCGSAVFKLPHTGWHRILVEGAFGSGSIIPEGRGAYEFNIFSIDPRPETVPANFAIGDTIRGEEIFPMGDTDEFNFHGEAGDSLVLAFRSPLEGLVARVVDDMSGDTLISHGANHPRDWGGFVLPRTGSYTVRIYAHNREERRDSFAPIGPVGEYTFSIVRNE